MSIQSNTSPIHGVYITSNESGCKRGPLKETIDHINQFLADSSSKMHVGVSGWFNFDIASARRSSSIIVFDVNLNQLRFMQKTIALAKNAANRKIFVENIVSYIKQHKQSVNIIERCNLYQPPIHLDYDCKSDPHEYEIRNELQRPSSWLAKDSYFNHIKTLAKENKISLIKIDICNPTFSSKVFQLAKTTQSLIDTIYISNIHHYIPDKKNQAFLDSLKQITREEAVLIHSESIKCNLTQVVTSPISKKQLSACFEKNLNRSKSKSLGRDLEVSKKVCSLGVHLIWSLSVIAIIKRKKEEANNFKMTHGNSHSV